MEDHDLESDAESSLAAWNDLAAEALYLHLEGAGLPASRYERGQTVNTGWKNLTCRCQVRTVKATDKAAMAGAKFEVFFNDTSGRSIVQSLASLVFEPDPRAAVVSTVHYWCVGVWPVIRWMVAPPPKPDEMTAPPAGWLCLLLDARAGSERAWLASCGEFLILGNDNPAAAMRRIVRGEPQHFLVDRVLREAASERPEGLHWGHVNINRTPDGNRVLECHVDNENWNLGTALLGEAPFPSALQFPGYLIFRQFFMFRPCSPEWREFVEGQRRIILR